jgi:hypothetical protein
MSTRTDHRHRPVHRVGRMFAALLALAGVTVVQVGPVSAASTASSSASSTASAASSTSTASACRTAPLFIYVRRLADSQPHGTLTLTACVAGAAQQLTVPAGSGRVENECAQDAGWLPLGTYAIYRHTMAGPKGFNGIIKGTTWGIGGKRCTKGKVRGDLFIHSEMTKLGGQGTPGTHSAWDGNSDYLSKGCIKVSPVDIGALNDLYNKADLTRGPGRVIVKA